MLLSKWIELDVITIVDTKRHMYVFTKKEARSQSLVEWSWFLRTGEYSREKRHRDVRLRDKIPMD